MVLCYFLLVPIFVIVIFFNEVRKVCTIYHSVTINANPSHRKGYNTDFVYVRFLYYGSLTLL
jgi:hypothetical protein